MLHMLDRRGFPFSAVSNRKRMNTLSMKVRRALIVFATMGYVLVPAMTRAATLTNDNGGDGYVTIFPNGFDLFGSNNRSGPNLTSYGTVASTLMKLMFNYTYTTNDCCGSGYDSAGYFIGSTFTTLSPPTSPAPYSFSDTVSFSVAPGETYGFFVATTDGKLGRADIAVSPGLGVSAVPLPASAPMFGAALLVLAGLGYAAQRKKVVAGT